jgi:hypothetical protein
MVFLLPPGFSRISPPYHYDFFLSLKVKAISEKREKKRAESERLSLSNRCKARNVFLESFN